MAGWGRRGGSGGDRWSESRSDVVGLKEEKRRRSVSKQEIDCRANVVCFVVCLFFFLLLCLQPGSTLEGTNSPKRL